jgi:hypothetical protein
MKARHLALALLALVVTLPGCAMLEILEDRDFLGWKKDFREAQRDYTQSVRWFEVAARFVDPEVREAFLTEAATLAGLRFTDYRVTVVKLESHSATAHVSYRLYDVTALIERTVTETQEWTRDDGNWYVKPGLESLRARVAGGAL